MRRKGEESKRPLKEVAGSAKALLVSRWVYTTVAVLFFLLLLRYYLTGKGGPTLLAVQMVPLALVVALWKDISRNQFYPAWFGWLRLTLALAFTFSALGAALYLRFEFESIRITRLGDWNGWDMAAGGVVTFLVLEYTFRKYLPVFLLNLALIFYCLLGPYLPGLLSHSGISVSRLSSSFSLEMSTGVFERLPQLGLTLIGSFLLLLAVLKAFGYIDSILRVSSLLATKSQSLLPQAAVVGSFSVAAVSGSGAANAATTGSVTIPMLVKAGIPKVKAAAIETAASLGGQIMPPLMGISAFLMAEILGVSYFEVVARGFAPALIYFSGVSFAVYLMTLRYVSGPVSIPVEAVTKAQYGQLLIYLLAMLILVWMLGYYRMASMVAARYMFFSLLLLSSCFFLAKLWQAREKDWKKYLRPYKNMAENFAQTTAELTVLLSALGILTAAFTVTGVPDKMGVLLMHLAEGNVFLMILAAFAFGYIIGMGLPVTPTYIILAVVVAPFLVRAGLDPWVAHFFAFLVAVFGELSPPTSVTAAVTSRIANTSFTKTMMHAMGICLPLLVMIAAVFTRPGLVLVPGWGQVPAFLLVGIGSLGLLACLYARWSLNQYIQVAVIAVLIPSSLLVLFVPNLWLAALVALPVLGMSLLPLFLKSR